MEVLAESKKFLRLSGLFQSDESTMVDKIRQVVKNCVFSTIFLVLIFGSGFHAYLHFGDISSCVIAFLEISGGLTAFVAYNEILINPSTNKRIFDELDRIANNGRLLLILTTSLLLVQSELIKMTCVY